MSVVPSQILYLEHGSSRLYAEVIQVVESRHLCWARPTLLIQGLPDNASEGLLVGEARAFVQQNRQEVIALAAIAPETSTLNLYDLENCPDLIWPLALFEIAYDTDFFSLIVQLKINPDESAHQNGTNQLNAFIRGFWHSHADAFPTCG
jgi:hypothetical protein